jgi:hypothetical protein
MTPLMPSNLIRSINQAVCAGLPESVIALGSILIVLGFLAGLPRSEFGTAGGLGSQGHLLSEYSDRRKWSKICLNISFESVLLCLPIRHFYSQFLEFLGSVSRPRSRFQILKNVVSPIPHGSSHSSYNRSRIHL